MSLPNISCWSVIESNKPHMENVPTLHMQRDSVIYELCNTHSIRDNLIALY